MKPKGKIMNSFKIVWVSAASALTILIGGISLLGAIDRPVTVADPDTIVLTSSNSLILNKPMMSGYLSKLSVEARELDRALDSKFPKSKPPIFLILSTPGGEVEAGLRFIDNLNSLGRPVHTVTVFAASMGFQTVQGLGERYILKSAKLMSHRATGGVEGSFGGQTPSQLENRLAFNKQLIFEMDSLTVKRTNGRQTLDSYTKAYSNELWLTGTTAVEGGYADKIMKVKCDDSLTGTTTTEVSAMGFSFQVTVDKCPVNIGILDAVQILSTTKGKMLVSEFLASGGGFGADCLSNKDRLCASDPTMTLTTIEKVKKAAIESLSTAGDLTQGFLF